MRTPRTQILVSKLHSPLQGPRNDWFQVWDRRGSWPLNSTYRNRGSAQSWGASYCPSQRHTDDKWIVAHWLKKNPGVCGGKSLFICQHQLIIVEVMTEVGNHHFANTNINWLDHGLFQNHQLKKIIGEHETYMISKYQPTDYLLITKNTRYFYNRDSAVTSLTRWTTLDH